MVEKKASKQLSCLLHCNYTGEERRLYPRLKAFLPVTYYTIDKIYKEEVTISLNISCGGVCIITNEDFYLGSNIYLRIDLLDGNYPIIIKGQTIWKKEIPVYFSNSVNYELGINILSIKNGDYNRLSNYIYNYLNSDYPYPF
ncbi:MAG: PilZ domain-containing protein [Candidatus Omnitrophica bacterium]|nr:PilZ domain-containing protein [Candidatus Omnitrophota bacterium]MCM8826125.1 PilZ domain-containing protein [Candidatus Omnitrophota bacterium]